MNLISNKDEHRLADDFRAKDDRLAKAFAKRFPALSKHLSKDTKMPPAGRGV